MPNIRNVESALIAGRENAKRIVEQQQATFFRPMLNTMLAVQLRKLPDPVKDAIGRDLIKRALKELRQEG